MIYMKKAFHILIFFIMTLVLYPQNIDIVIYGDENYPPYSYVENGIFKGIYTEIIKEAAKEIEGYNVDIKAVPWRRGLKLIENGGGFAIYPPYFRPRERPWMDYSIPILEEVIVILMNREFVDEDEDWIEQLKSLKIGKNSGFEPLSALSNSLDLRWLSIEEADSTRMNLLKLGTERIDAYVNDKISMLWTLKELKENGEYRSNFAELQLGHVISTEHGHIGYTTKNDSIYYYKKDFKDKMDFVLQKMKKEGRIEDITFRYIDYSLEN